MDIKKLQILLDKIPTGLSNYELNTFVVSTELTPARHLVNVMLEIEETQCQIIDLTTAQLAKNERSIKTLTQKLKKLSEWYDNLDAKYIKETLSNYEKEESEYWSNYLGRQAAIELLTYGKIKFETMNKMADLPTEDFEESTKICLRYSNLINSTVSMIERKLKSEISGLKTNEAN